MLFVECGIFCKFDLSIILISPPLLVFHTPPPELYNYLSYVSKHVTNFGFRNNVTDFLAFCSTENGHKAPFDAQSKIMINSFLYILLNIYSAENDCVIYHFYSPW
jgi:hypothetical protein